MAHVYLAVMRGLHGFNKLVVLKVPRDSVAADPNLLSMFHEEARLAARLNHPNVVHTYEVIQEEGRDITVMEYLDGQPLNAVLARGRKLGKPMALAMHLRLVSEALTGLHHAHEAKDYDGKPLELVHRDVSPPNLFVTFDGGIKVLDFGIAKAVTSLNETQTGTFKGRIRYMPPEQLMGGKVDRRTDIFAIGAVLWDAAVGESMWKGRTDVEVISAVLGDEKPTPRSVRADVPEELDAIVRKAMAHVPRNRYANCVELQADIDAFLAKLPEKYSSRDLAMYMNDLFSEIRETRRRIIENQLARVRTLPSGEYQALEATDLPQPSARTLPKAKVPSPSESTTPSAPVSLGSLTSSSITSMRPPATDSEVSPMPRKRRAGTLLALIGVVIVVGGAVVVGKSLKGTGGGAESAASAPSGSTAGALSRAGEMSASAAAAPSASASGIKAEGEVVTVLRAEPSDARLFLDDTPLGSNPSIQRGPKDTSSHVLRAEAKGYAPKSTTVVMLMDSEIVLRLDKEASPSYGRSYTHARAPKEPAAAAAATTPPSPPSASSSAQPTRSDSDLKPNKKQARPI
ncbi:MAG TPA: serine/threonine-protein kinase, partial [Polyangiaceae bacterium]|nr:serine/threonine-protein kinase [Polyangiaceae bacterium]